MKTCSPSRVARRAAPGARRGAMHGVTLIEILVSVLIMCFGILAMISMMNVASRYNKTTEFRSVAVLMANDYADRIRANYEGRAAYGLAAEYEAAVLTDPVSVPPCAIANECLAAELALVDQAQWRNSLLRALPGAAGFATWNAAAQAYDLWVGWVDPAADANAPKAGNECPAEFGDTPRCVYMRVAL